MQSIKERQCQRRRRGLVIVGCDGEQGCGLGGVVEHVVTHNEHIEVMITIGMRPVSLNGIIPQSNSITQRIVRHCDIVSAQHSNSAHSCISTTERSII